MDSRVREFIDGKGVNEELRESLERLTSAESAAAGELIDALSPTTNTLRELLRLAIEISARDEISLAELFQRPELSELSASKMSRKQKALAVGRELKCIRFPEMSRIRNELDESAAAVRRDLGVSLTLPEDMEGIKVSLVIEGRDAEDFGDWAARCAALAEHPQLKRIFQLLKGEETDDA